MLPKMAQTESCGSPALATAFAAWKRVNQLLKGEELVIDGQNLGIGAVAAVAQHGCTPKLSSDPALLEGMEASVKVLMEQLENGYYIYGLSNNDLQPSTYLIVKAGVNTGFGGSADSRTNQLISLQAALLQHTQAGVLVTADKTPGDCHGSQGGHSPVGSHAMPDSWVRAAIAHGITPVIPLRGSVSASGDLMPLSYIAGAIEGSPDVYVRVRCHTASAPPKIMSAREALISVGVDARTMGPKEGLCIVNGTSSSAGLAALVMYESHLLSVLVQALSGMAVEALLGNSESFHPFISAARPHDGQIECARNVLYLLQGSGLAQNMANAKDRNRSGLIQDRYSLRSVPQWIGPQLEDLLLAHRQVVTELNSSCDNPLVDAESNDVYYGCNFQAASVTSGMEKTRTALQMLGKLVFAQTTEMINPHLNNGLPTNLVADDPNLSFTMKGVDTNMAAYMAELAYLAHPVSAHIQAAEMQNQSVNSMALASSRFSMDAVEVLSIMCACHLYVSCQALDLRALHMRFLERASEALYTSTALTFPYLSEESSHQLNAALSTNLAETWPKTNTLAIEERCLEVVKTSLDVLVHTFTRHESTAKPSVADLSLWKSRTAKALNDSYKTTIEVFVPKPNTADLLGRGSRVLYQTVRETLGVPFHLGLAEHPTIQGGTLHGRDKRTIGSWISIIYEAIRTSHIFGPLMEALEANTYGATNGSCCRQA
ncbi:hypothetical protein DL767_004862 [Monosporascus sp. MG133]|nr:hypothetical protein DL767_004862 [Monosporascus sp. MG133]